MNTLRVFAVTVLMFLTSACSTGIDTYKATKPELKLEEFFKGELVAYGMVQDYSGEVIQRFEVTMTGTWNGNKGVLDEHFTYADGREQQRVWHITKTGPNSYEGRADDIEGVAKGTTAGNVLNWEYQLEVQVDGKPMVLTLDDWLYLIDENNMINRTAMYKWGIPVGEITLYIGKK
ncbi:DUF3833 domain-containing protein [Idiomarina sp. HP20-50]|uniref:DUF3833 domain-containing protein n=1 Tax=Idiomarina sp. HP20-50 TaxID=3070813 RepID=UPI00294AC444|nr:DUF3833 domain-containing protein [Idiomarina sp. HP20-50]MDV6315022.1 DUF3833 domain-containing protein [Idiomarina sp. HP20-50]